MLSRIVSLCLFAIAVLAADLHAQAQVDVRVARRTPGTRVAELIRPNEGKLTVVDSADPPLIVDPGPGESLLSWNSRLADAVAVIDVISRESALTSTEDWVRSTVRAVVVDVLKSVSAAAITAGSEISFTEEGGEVLIGNAQVSALVPSARPIREGRRYLVFASVTPDGRNVGIGPDWIYEVTPGQRFRRLSSRRLARPDQDDLENSIVDDTLGRIRAFEFKR